MINKLKLVATLLLLSVSLQANDHPVAQVEFILSQNYKQKVDPRILNYAAIQGMITKLNDPYTRLLSPKRTAQIKRRVSGKHRSGVGLYYIIRDQTPLIISTHYDSKTRLPLLRPGNLLVAIDGVSTKGLSEFEINALLIGPKGSIAKCQILKPGFNKPTTVHLTRQNQETKCVRDQSLIYDKVAIIKLSTFSSSCTKEMFKALVSLKKAGAKGFVLDLRDNRGGPVKNAVNIASLFIKKGPIVKIKERRNKRTTTLKANGQVILSKDPLIVLVNENTASSAELLAAALHDNGRSTTVGSHTYGKTSIQRLAPLSNGMALIYTSGWYESPNNSVKTNLGIPIDRMARLDSGIKEAISNGEIELNYDIDTPLQTAVDIALLEIDKFH